MNKHRLKIISTFFIVLTFFIFPSCLLAKSNSVKPNSLNLTKPPVSTLDLRVKEKYRLGVKVLPNNAGNKQLAYKSNRNSVATVSKDGVVRARKAGNAIITVTSKANKKVNAKFRIRVLSKLTKVNRITLKNLSNTLYIGGKDRFTVQATISPGKATNKKLTYVSSNPKTVSVSAKGLVRALKVGSSKITVYASDGRGAKKSFTVRSVPSQPATTEPAVTPTVVPTTVPATTPPVSVTSAPTATPTVKPTASPTTAPTATPTTAPTPTPTPIVTSLDLTQVARMDEGVNVSQLEDGSVQINFPNVAFSSAIFALPEYMDLSEYLTYEVDATVEEQFGFGILNASFQTIKEYYPGYSITTSTRELFTDTLSADGAKSLSDAKYVSVKTLNTIGSNDAKHTPVVLHSIRFIEDTSRFKKIVLPFNAGMNYTRLSSATITNANDGGAQITFPAKWKDAVFALPQTYDLSNYTGMSIKCIPQTSDGANGEITFGIATSNATTSSINDSRPGGKEYYSGVTASDVGKETTYHITFSCKPEERTSILYFFAKSNSDNLSSLTIQSVTFIPNAYTMEEIEQNLADLTTGDSLKNAFAKHGITMGVAIEEKDVPTDSVTNMIQYQFNSITYANELKPDSLLVQSTSQSSGTPCINEEKINRILTYAKNNNLPVRGHALLWHNQTPDWFFKENFNSTEKYVSKEVMSGRLEAYITKVVTYCETNFPGVVYAWDVVNEAVTGTGYRTDGNWYNVYKDESYIFEAFRFARNCTKDTNIKLFYNDFSTYSTSKRNVILGLLNRLIEEGLIDGMGMQSHVSLTNPSINSWRTTLQAFGATGLEIQLTEMDIQNPDNDNTALADRYETLINAALTLKASGEANVTNITFWGINDSVTWLTGPTGDIQYPLLFDGGYMKKEAYHRLISLASK